MSISGLSISGRVFYQSRHQVVQDTCLNCDPLTSERKVSLGRFGSAVLGVRLGVLLTIRDWHRLAEVL